MQTIENPIRIRKAEKRDLLDIHINDTSMYRTSFDGSKSISFEWLNDFHNTFDDGMCIAEIKSPHIVVGHSLSFSFNKRFDETDMNFVYNSRPVSSLFEKDGITFFGKSIVAIPESRKYHTAYGLFKWMVVNVSKKYPKTKYVLALCENDNSSRKLHYAMGYTPVYVYNKLFHYDDNKIVDGILMEIEFDRLFEGFTKDTYKKWFGVTGTEPEYVF